MFKALYLLLTATQIRLPQSLLLLAASFILVSPNSYSQGTSAGQAINSSTTMSFIQGGQTITQQTDYFFPVVNEILNFTLTSEQNTVDVINNQQAAVLTFQLVNNGNGPEDFLLDFSPALNNDFSISYDVYYENFDSIGNNTLSVLTGGTDEATYSSGQAISLAADQHIVIYLLANIPSSLLNGSNYTVELAAISQSKDINNQAMSAFDQGQIALGAGAATYGVASTASAGQKELSNGVATDMIIATAFGRDVANASFFVNETGVSVEKTIISSEIKVGNETITGRFVKGATVTYLVAVTVNTVDSPNNINAKAENLTINDLISNDMSYIPGSLQLQENGGVFAIHSSANTISANDKNITVELGDKPKGIYRIKYQAIIN